ncbi:MAG: NigD-like C-terminal domain-containing protein [Bacteroidales bacterium]|nr:NigD-like C-terminal domain-containing protein [Bacteroidales bacterium]
MSHLRRPHIRLRLAALLLVLTAPLVACSDDEEVAKSFRQDLAEIVTDADGVQRYLVRDDGDTLLVTNGAARNVLSPDTVYRVRALYTLNDQGAEVSTLTSVFSPNPVEMTSSVVLRDSLSLDAIWRGGRYVNLLVSYKSGGINHSAAFIDNGIVTSPSGTRLLRLTLYHSNNGDREYYTQQVYMSCPLYNYADQLTSGRDSIEFTVTTYDGTVKHRLPY